RARDPATARPVAGRLPPAPGPVAPGGGDTVKALDLDAAAWITAALVTALRTPEQRRVGLLLSLRHYQDRYGFKPRALYDLAALHARALGWGDLRQAYEEPALN